MKLQAIFKSLLQSRARLTLALAVCVYAAAVNIAPPAKAAQGGTAALVNAAPRVLKAPPGLLLMTDIGVPSYA